MIADDPNASDGDRIISRWLTNIDKIVFSSTIDASPWARTTVTHRTPADVVGGLRASEGDGIVVLGSMSIIDQLLAADLVDRLSVTLAPGSLAVANACWTISNPPPGGRPRCRCLRLAPSACLSIA